MGLYPTTTLTFDQADGFNVVAPGSLTLIPITVANLQAMVFTLIQVAQTQDFTLRYWASVAPGGLPLNGDYNLHRAADQTYAVADRAATLPDNLVAALVAPGNYYINVLNLANAENCFQFNGQAVTLD